jgi:peptidylprolyl isomerase
MSENNSKKFSATAILTVLFLLVFVAVLIYRFSPLGAPEHTAQTGQVVTKAHASTSQNITPITLILKGGEVEIELWGDVAPNHVERISSLAEKGFYDGIVFHRVIDGFMAQTGDPTGTGMGGSDLPDLKAEFNDELFVRGSLGMARSQDPDSANSQFFITFGDTPFLNGSYTVFGKVVSGMEHVDAIKKGNPDDNGLVTDPDKIISLKLGKAE